MCCDSTREAMRRSLVAWHCSMRVGAGNVVLALMMLISLGSTVLVESRSARAMSVGETATNMVRIEQRSATRKLVAASSASESASSSSAVSSWVAKVEDVDVITTELHQWPKSQVYTNLVSNLGDKSVKSKRDFTVYSAESRPSALRQRDHRRLWGVSKRLVPTGPNPLHN